MKEESSPTPSNAKRYDVFISYAHADGAWVERLAENLHHAGLEVFFDRWEIGSGEVVAHALDRGLAHARSGVLVVSPTSLSRPWVRQEYAVLLAKAVEQGGLLIPVLLEDAELPPMLATRLYVDFRDADGPAYEAAVERLVAALKAEQPGPPPRRPGTTVAPPDTGCRPEGPLGRTLRIDRREAVLLGGPESVTAEILGDDPATEQHLWQLDRELRRRGGELHREEAADPAAAAADRLHGRQLEAGAALGRAFLPVPVAEALRRVLGEAERAGAVLRLGLEVADDLLGLPWETLRLPPAVEGGPASEPLALHPRVSLYRAVRSLGPTPAIQIPGPLRILVAIGSPEAQNARGELLDMEAELARILDAVEPARKAAQPAHVRILEYGTVQAINEALRAERYHVLHLSCHARPGVLVLEKEDGKKDEVDVERLWREALPGGRGVPLVVLAGCATAVGGSDGEEELPGLAQGLLARGMPAVLAMRVSVSDAYATALAGALYRSLATSEVPATLVAFSEARRALERERLQEESQGPRPEWSTPLLFLRGEGAAAAGATLYDPKALFEEIEPPKMARLAAGVVSRRMGEFVGRRGDQRKILARLGQEQTGGVLIRGLGGVGKSTLSAQLVAKLAGEGWLVVSQFGEVDPDGILEAVGARLRGLAQGDESREGQALRSLAQEVRERNVDPAERLERLAERVLEHLPLILLLDNFEDNLTPLEDEAFELRDEQLGAFLAAWLERPGKSRLLITCRYPVPFEGVAARKLHDHHLGPLSFAEARKLLWRLPGLDALGPEDRLRAYAAVGGHPRALEYLDALLHGEARFAEVAERLEAAIRKREGIEDPGAWMRERGDGLDEALATAVTLAADDVLLDGLLERLASLPLAERLLLGASVYRLPVAEAALVWQVGEVPGLPREPAPFPEVSMPEGYAPARRALEELGLLAPVDLGGGQLFTVHRWTASGLAGRSSQEELKEAHRRAALFWRWHFATIGHTLEDLLEARHHHHRAEELEEAVLTTEWICSQFQTWGMYRREEQLIHEALGWLPQRSEKAARFWAQLGNLAVFRGAFDQASQRYEEAIPIFEEVGDREGTASAYHQLGVVDQKRGDYDQALGWYRKSLEINEELGNRAGMASSYHQLGMVDQERGNYDHALGWYRKSLEISEELGDRAGMAISYHQLGRIDEERGNYDQALVWYRKSLEIKEELGNRAGMAITYHQLGMVDQKRGNYDEALGWYRESLEISEELGDRAGMAITYHQLGMVDQKRGNYDEALGWYRKSLEIKEELGNRAGMAITLSQIGVLLTERDRPAEAVPLNLRSLGIRLDLRVPQARIDLYWLGRQREALGDEKFRELLTEHTGAEGAGNVLALIEQFEESGAGEEAS